MFSMNNLINTIAEKISSELNLDNDRKEVIAYGIFAILQTLLSILLVILFGAIFGVLSEALIVSFSISILRKYSGGVHASSPGICAVIGTVISIGQALLISFIVTPLISLKLVILLGLLTFAWSFYIIVKLAPVDSAAKPIKTLRKKERLKKESIFILGAYGVIVLINVIIYLLTNNIVFLNFSICICGGTVWQVFTLTHGGHLTFWKIDAFLNHILTFIRRKE